MYKTIAKSNHFIVLDKYTQNWAISENYQSEQDLEKELIEDLQNQGYEYDSHITTTESMLKNIRLQLQKLNKIEFSDSERQRFITTYSHNPSDSIIEKTRKIHDDYVHDFVFDNGQIQNIYLIEQKHCPQSMPSHQTV